VFFSPYPTAILIAKQAAIQVIAISLVIELMKEKQKLEQENKLLKARLNRVD
jgi:hypothetical protein